jgi:hypothetical protein
MNPPTGIRLSFVLCGRNDDYGGDFKYRLATAVNSFCIHAAEIGALEELEVVLVDWNSDTPIVRDLRLSPQAASATRFIVVPPRIAAGFNRPGRAYHNALPVNIGIRRARGEFVMMAPADVVFSKSSVRSLFDLVRGRASAVFDATRAFLCVGRKYVPWQFWERKPGLEEWSRYIQLHSHHLWYENHLFHGICGGYGALLAHRDLWHECQGIREDVSGWGATDIDLGIRLGVRYPTIALAGLGIECYDMQSRPDSNVHRILPAQEMPHTTPSEIAQDNAAWGLAGQEFGEMTSRGCGHFGYTEEEGRVTRIDLGGGNVATVSRDLLISVQRSLYLANRTDYDKSFLAWYAKRFLPKRYLEFGVGPEALYSIVARRVPSTELYLIDPFRNPGPNFAAQTQVAKNLAATGHKGFVHIVCGDPRTALERLRLAFVGPMSFELVVFRPQVLATAFEQQLVQTARLLALNGALVVRSRDAASFSLACERLQAEFPERLLVIAGDAAAVMLNIR